MGFKYSSMPWYLGVNEYYDPFLYIDPITYVCPNPDTGLTNQCQ